LIDDLERLKALSFIMGLTECKAVHMAYAQGQGDFSDEMTLRVRCDVLNHDGQLMLAVALGFSDCPTAEKLGQKTMLVRISELTPESLDALDYFVAWAKASMGITKRFFDASEEPPPGYEAVTPSGA
jgi:hypothetical protein